jgi:NAD(P)H-hydrate epimerase
LCERHARGLPAEVARLTQLPTEKPALIIDALLGAGSRGKPHEPLASALTALRALAQQGVPVLAADVPSGLGSEFVLPATRTICLQVAKAELLKAPGVSEFITVDIGVTPAAYLEVQPCCLRRFPLLKKDGHKGTHGELLVIGGGRFSGALEFACRAGVLTGCDLIRAWTAGATILPPTVVVHRQPGETLTPEDPEDLTPQLARASCVLIGPGLGRDRDAHDAARQAFSLANEMGVPMVLDADGITACAEMVRALPESDGRLLLTPHAGEARSLFGRTPSDEVAHAFARRDRVILAKGPVDLITDGWRWQKNPRGNPRMAVGGTGDVLAGLAAGLMARGALPFDAARMAVLWLTTCADELWLEQGPCYDSLTILDRLPATLRSYLTPLKMWPPV